VLAAGLTLGVPLLLKRLGVRGALPVIAGAKAALIVLFMHLADERGSIPIAVGI
jgi:hypothetical protein